MRYTSTMSSAKDAAFVDYYELLGVKTDAEVRTIRAHYLKHAKNAHPDTGGATEDMQLLNKAYKTLANTTSRAAYDLMHSAHTGKSSQQYHYVEAPSSGDDVGDDEYIDMFLDQVYREFSADKAAQKRKKKPKDIISDFFSR